MKKHSTFTKWISVICAFCIIASALIGCMESEEIKKTPSVSETSAETTHNDIGKDASDGTQTSITPTQDPTPTRPKVEIVTTDNVKAEYSFSGKFADAPGYASGKITVTPTENGIKSGYYVFCFSKDGKILEEYEPLTVVKITGSVVSVELPYGMLLPFDATEILVFESNDETLKNDPGTPADAIIIPESKMLKAEESYYYSFASVSDVHLNYTDYGASDKWTSALNFFAEKELNAVISSGDMTGGGTSAEYKAYTDAIAASNFSADRIYEARGNHDSPNNTLFLKNTKGDSEIRPYASSPYFYVLEESGDGHKDNLFIFMAQELTGAGNTNLQNNFSEKQLDWLEELLEEYSGTNTNIFLVQHAVIHNFGPGDRYNGIYVQPMIFSNKFESNLRFKEILTEYKEVIMMTGHTHISFYDFLNYSDEDGTAARMIHNSSISQPRCYTASGSISYDSEGRTTKTAGSEGYLVYVYDEYILYIGYNLTTKKIIPKASFILESYVEKRDDVTAIELKSAPTKLEYTEGEFFDPRGIVLEGTFKDGTKNTISGWSYDKVGELTANDKEVIISYSGKTVSVKIMVKANISENFKGNGTKSSPYIIENADDFLKLTALFNKSTDASAPYGEGKYFIQTADIDMTGVEGYEGTKAQGSKKYYFGGYYNGDGHTLTANITSTDGECSVFPYITGIIYNLTMRGSIKAPESAQPVRTLQKSGIVANCDISMTLDSAIENGLCYSNHGVLYRVYVHSEAKNPINTTNDGKTYNVITSSADGEKFINESESNTTDGINAIKNHISDFAVDDFIQFVITDGELTLAS